MANVAALTKKNAARWEAAKATRPTEFRAVAQRLVASKPRFQALSVSTGVPWFVIAVIKQRECGDDPAFLGNICNGQPWNRVTTIVPKGRGPFRSFEAAAVDALTNCAPFAAKWKDWSPGGALTLLEQYNGLGYANRGLPSPYIWSGTDQYQKGKYIADGVFDANVVDRQLGCAGLIKAMQLVDPSIRFGVAPTPSKAPERGAAAAVVVAGGAGAAKVAQHNDLSAGQIAAIVLVVALAVAGLFFAIRKRRHG